MTEDTETKVAQRLERHGDPSLDQILGLKFDVLKDGHVRIIDYMGGDAAVVQAARVSYGKGTKTVSDDRELIRYLMRNRHTTPFEMAEIKLHVRVPMDVWRQWIRNRTASVNEYSTRYSEAIDSAHTTLPGEWRVQSGTNKQGSGGFLPEDIGADLSLTEDRFLQAAREVYDERLKAGVAREQARKDLPLSTYTEAYWKIDLHNLLHFLSLRLDLHAQEEIRAFARAINSIVKVWVPETWHAFQDYRLDAMTLSGPEVAVLVRLLSGVQLKDNALEDSELTEGMTKREVSELEAKLERLGLT